MKKKNINKVSVSYRRGDGVVEIIIRDDRGSKQDRWKANLSDKKEQKKIATLLFQKYDINFTPTIGPEFYEQEKQFFDEW